jgi:pyruvate dehydrogenase E1 component alpha subunit
MPLDREELGHLYQQMVTIRRFEERVSEEFQGRAIPGVVHSYIGQEAVAVGVCSSLRPDDRIVSTHRGHGHCIAKGADLKRMMAELYGRKTGYCQGKGGSMHIADFDIGMLGANGIVGAGLPISVGAGLAAKLDGGDRVVVCFFGDGASQEGTFHESLNLASIWKLPIIFACENNLYGSTVSLREAVPVTDVASRAAAYAMPGVVVDGNDVLTVRRAAEEAVARARGGEGPTLLEFKTYRWRGHTEFRSLPDSRPPEEIESWKQRCPIARLEQVLLQENILTRGQMDEIEGRVRSLVEEAVSFALESPLPAPEDALSDVFSP